jgi:Mu-like prophage protein gp29
MQPTDFEGQFATRARAGEINAYFALLPDPDPVLRKKGIDISALRPLLADPHLESVASVRVAAVSSIPWRLVAGGEEAQAAKALALAEESFARLDVPGIIEEAMESVFYGFKPLEVLWDTVGRWVPSDIVGKPPEWFGFDQDNVLVFKGKTVTYEDIPPYRIACARHRASYDNPYGQKAFAKCFWPVTFKRAGWQWWTTFIEKYGGLIALGKYPKSDEKDRGQLLEFLEQMVSDAVGAVPDGTDVILKEAADKSGSSEAYSTYLRAADDEISKAILGQTLTTQVGAQGSYASAKVHDMVRQDLADADKRRISSTFNQILAWIAELNLGEGTPAPRFVFEEAEELKKDKAERDKILWDMGVRFSKTRISSEYGIPEDGFEITDTASQAQFGGFSLRPRRPAPRSADPQAKRSFLRFFQGEPKATKEEKRIVADVALADSFAQLEEARFARAAEKTVQTLLDKIEKAASYKEVVDIVAEAYPELDFDEVVAVLEDIRYAADQIGSAPKDKG